MNTLIINLLWAKAESCTLSHIEDSIINTHLIIKQLYSSDFKTHSELFLKRVTTTTKLHGTESKIIFKPTIEILYVQ